MTVLTDILLHRAETTPAVLAYEHAGPGGLLDRLTYGELAARASALAARLATAPDGPVLLAEPAGLGYVVGVFGTFLAGRAVIPAAPPGPGPDAHRLGGIVADARPAVVLARQRFAEIAVPFVLDVPGADADTTPLAAPGHVDGASIGVVQYTSGSTGTPRGILVRHDALTANTAAITERFGLGPGSRALTWLPPFHDMGLVGGLLTPTAAGIPMRILAPADFLKAPLSWLRQISEHGITHSGGPNFAYDLCVLRARRDDALDGLDLSHWRVAFSGGEPVRQATLTAFAQRFARAGFRPEAFLPCYGLAEATLMVAAGHWSGRAHGERRVVGCGTPVPGQRVVVVDPAGRPVADGVEGEIWVAGPHITAGHLTGTAAGLFGDLDGVRHLRTGDLGYLLDAQLHVSGRAKDVLVHRGVNHHAVDVEAAALAAIGPAGRRAAAFTVDTGAAAGAVVAVESRGRRDAAGVAAVSAAVLERTGLLLSVVVLLPPRTLPRTSSGKLRRSAARAAFLAGEFDPYLDMPPSPATGPEQPGDELTDLVGGVFGAVCDAPSCGPDDDLAALGLDSVRAAEAVAVLEDALGFAVPVESVVAAPTPRAVAAALHRRWAADGHGEADVRARIEALGAGVA